jgi:hypothetical protein
MIHIYVGVFHQGKCVFRLGGNVWTTHRQAEIVVRILDLAKECLEKDHYFAYDFVKF